MENTKITLKDLAVDHDYYCSDNNYYSNEASGKYDTFPEFYSDFKDADTDMNLVFRWDIKEFEEVKGKYYMEVFMMLQRKGIFRPIHISRVFEDDVDIILQYLKPHKEKLESIWKPL